MPLATKTVVPCVFNALNDAYLFCTRVRLRLHLQQGRAADSLPADPSESSRLAVSLGFDRITEIAVEHHARRFGRTKFGLERYIRGFLDLLSVLFLTRFAARPMHFFGTLGTLAFFGGFAISLWISIDKMSAPRSRDVG